MADSTSATGAASGVTRVGFGDNGRMHADVFHPLDEFDYHPVLRATRGPVLVLFSSPDCGGCRRVEALLPAAVAALPGPDRPRLFRVDVQQSPGLSRAFEVFHLPALFLYRHGQYHARLDCAVTPAALGEALVAAWAAPAQEEP